MHTARALDVNPEAYLAIEDSAAGVIGARAAGMVVLGLGPEERVGGAHAVLYALSNVHFKDLQEIYHRCREIERFPHPLREIPQAA